MKRTGLSPIILSVLFFSCTAVTKNIDAYVYELPYKEGTGHRIVQGYGGIFSHRYRASLDFKMPVGTPVYAAREGEILRYTDTSDEGGPWRKYQRKANYIMIRHSDGTIGCYWHLMKNGVVVKSGSVSKGQLIGYSGKTGFAFSPHLHFTVRNRSFQGKDAFVKTKFRTTKGNILLKGGKKYKRPSS